MKMKKIFILSLLAGTFLVSCNNDLLEPFTPGSLTEEVAFTSSVDLQRLMNSTYGLVANREDVVFSSVFTDECGIGFANGGQGINDNYVFFLNISSTSPDVIWSQAYTALARANRVIVFADKIIAATDPSNSSEVAKLRFLKAEALTIRALLHLKIMAYFSPDLKNNDALAGVLADRIFSTSDAPRLRNKNSEFYTLIHKDLDDALVLFTTTASPYTGATAKLYASANLARGLKARAYAYKGDYTNAETWANNVISTSGLVLATATTYSSVFLTDAEPATTEVIFRLKRTLQQSAQASNIGNGYASVNPTIAGSPFYEIGRSLFNILDANPTDVRRAVIVHPTSKIDPNYKTSTDYRNTDVLLLGKYPGSASVGNLNSDFKLMRLSEMYFIRAEARVAAGDLAGAAAAVKAVIDGRFPTAQPAPVYANATAAWKGILDQRRLEFAFEGYRFIDLKRIGILAGAAIDRDPADYSSSSSNYPGGNPSNLPLTSTKFALPIPQTELNANPTIQQNTGY
jgi:starch-binding outer membrane protein, SusD/RagB family